MVWFLTTQADLATSRNALQHASEIDDSEQSFESPEMLEFEDSGGEGDADGPVVRQ